MPDKMCAMQNSPKGGVVLCGVSVDPLLAKVKVLRTFEKRIVRKMNESIKENGML
jgi:hypothetical protein